VTAQYQGWADYDDDELLSAAEPEFAVFVILDTNLIHQQTLSTNKTSAPSKWASW
jgi:hypothetical protein